MNALSYIASDPYVQIAFLGTIVAITIAALIARWRRLNLEMDYRTLQFRDEAEMRKKQFDREVTAIEHRPQSVNIDA